jgi:hypothetical protein
MSRDCLHLILLKKADSLGHAGDKGERYSSYSFFTSALHGVSGQRHAPAGKGPPVHILQAGWASELVWTQRLEEKSFAPAGDRTPVVQSVARHCTEVPRLLYLVLYVT